MVWEKSLRGAVEAGQVVLKPSPSGSDRFGVRPDRRHQAVSRCLKDAWRATRRGSRSCFHFLSFLKQRSILMRITEIWRYPVSSMGGERLNEADLTVSGLQGDRAFSLVCRGSGDVASPESSARWQTVPMVMARGSGLDLEIRTPQSAWLPAFGRVAREALDDHFGFPVALRRTAPWREPASEAQSVRPRYPRAPLHLVSRDTLNALEKGVPAQGIGAQRLRANLVLEFENGDEQALLRAPSILHFRNTSIQITGPTERCAFVALAQAGLPRSPETLRIIKRDYGLQFGHYANVVRTGRLTLSAPPDASSRALVPDVAQPLGQAT